MRETLFTYGQRKKKEHEVFLSQQEEEKRIEERIFSCIDIRLQFFEIRFQVKQMGNFHGLAKTIH